MTHIPWCENSEAALPIIWELFTSFCLLCMKPVSVHFQSSQKPLMCNLVSLLYSHLWIPVCGVWNTNRRAKVTPFMVSPGPWSMIYTAEITRTLQAKHWRGKGDGGKEGITKHNNEDLAQVRGCDAVGNGEAVCGSKTQFYMLMSALNFKSSSIARREGFINCLWFVFFFSLSAHWCSKLTSLIWWSY